MTILDAVWLGIIEGITEFLPVSSTGHLILASKLLGLPETEFLKTFEIAIQLGAILSVVVLYARSFLLRLEVIKRLMAAFVPTAILGFIFYKIVKTYFLGNAHIVTFALFFGGLFMILFERAYKEKPGAEEDISKLSYKSAVLIGIFQSFAMVPGISRSAATIIGGLVLGMKRKAIVEFSFLLAVPTMLAATVLDVLKSDAVLTADTLPLLGTGFAVAFVVAIVAIKWLLGFIKKHNFVSFGVYRMLAAAAFWYFIGFH